jgi:hypothetical protein
VSARDELFSEMDPTLTREDRNALIDALIHELAEKIRNHPWRECCGGGCSDMPDDVADFIDPKGYYERTR